MSKTPVWHCKDCNHTLTYLRDGVCYVCGSHNVEYLG